MKSVYARMLLWSVGILVLSWAAFILVSRGLALKAFGKDGDLGILIAMQFDEADRIYQAEGKVSLAAYIQVLNKTYPGDHYYMASGGRDMLTGADLSRLTSVANSPWSVVQLTGPLVFSVTSPNRNYALVVVGRFRNLVDYLPYYLLLLCAVAALCWVFTLQFASPLKNVMNTVERFGRGDLTARANLVRGDEVGALARSFDHMADRIETLLNSERRLLQDISHELRSPLTRLLMAVKLVGTGGREAARGRIHKEVQRIVDLVESLTQVTRAESDSDACNLESMSLDVLVAELMEDCHIEARARDCSFLLDGPSHATLRADRELLRRAIENVFRNAIHYAPTGSAIEINFRRTEADVTISVRDRGPGVPADDLSNIFKPFFRSDESRTRSTGGVGLGLAIAERAIQVHDGSIWAENADPGLRVCLRLPLIRAAELAAARQ